jgi:hypothetical protein
MKLRVKEKKPTKIVQEQSRHKRVYKMKTRERGRKMLNNLENLLKTIHIVIKEKEIRLTHLREELMVISSRQDNPI